MFSHRTQIRVRYGETDQMGFLYYGNYAQYYEVGRVEALRSLGLSYAELESVHNILMPVREMKIKYIKPALYDELLTVETSIKTLAQKTITFYVKIFGENGDLINRAQVVLCFIDADSKALIEYPPLVLEQLKSYFE